MQITKGYIHAKNTIHANYKIMQINVYQRKSAPYIYPITYKENIWCVVCSNERRTIVTNGCTFSLIKILQIHNHNIDIQS